MEAIIYNQQGQETGKINLPSVFETKVSESLIHEIVTGYLANQRSGTHNTKTRAEVSGGGRKPWKQKGTGNARAGSIRSPLWRKGGIIFGPKPRDYSKSIPQKKRQIGLKMALSVKAGAGDLIVIENAVVSEPKTKKIAEILKNLKIENENILLVTDKIDANLKLAARNVRELDVAEAKNLNIYQVMKAKKIVFTSAAIEQFKVSE